MATAYIDKFKVSGVDYEIQAPEGADAAYYADIANEVVSAVQVASATSVGSAKGINSTYKISIGGDVSGDDLVGTAISAAKTINTRITNVPWKAISATNASGSQSDVTYDSTAWSSTNQRFLSPKVVSDYVESQVSSLAEDAGLYQAKGNIAFSGLTATTAHHNGFVYNVTTSGTIPTTSGYNSQTFEVQPGDNLVWIQDNTKPGWDKLADPFAVAKSTLKEYSAASASMNNFTHMADTVSTAASSWDNSKHNLFSTLKANTTNLNATSYNSTINLSGINVSAGGTSPTATFGFSGVSAYNSFGVKNAAGTSSTINAASFGDTFTFGAGNAITLTPTVDTNGNPTITINKTNTKYSKATSSTNGMVQASYYEETDTTNHIGKLIIQGNMSSTTFTGSDL